MPRERIRRAAKVQHVLSARQCKNRKLLAHLFSLADSFRKQQESGKPLAGKTLATLFYEPSTRTRLYFQQARNGLYIRMALLYWLLFGEGRGRSRTRVLRKRN